MNDSVTLSDLDRRIIAALQVDARASFATIGAVLGEHDRTIARRAERLMEAGAVRLTAFVDELKTGSGQPVSLRIAVEPGATDTVAEALADRPDIRTVMAVTGEADLCCELVAPDKAALHRVLTHELPAIAGLQRTRTYAILHHVKPTSAWRLPVLSPDQTRSLGRESLPADGDETVHLSPADLELLEALRDNARCSYVDLAHLLGVTPSTARRRLEQLLDSGAVALRAFVEPELLGLSVEADIWLRVQPDSVMDTASRLASHSEVTYCGVVAGSYGLELVLALHDLDQLHRFLADTVAAEAAVLDSEPTLVTHTYKRGYLHTRPRRPRA